MSKKIICDICERIVENPYEAKVVRFRQLCGFDPWGTYPIDDKEKIKFDICGDCLKHIKELTLKDNS